ncbi:hypothetical protein VNO77_00300 [Canavalia gladiata]|uniref:Uncharacterized protein n=1 Tax=Canavalia gladiata TaxID=3824 RepID=A0AAN9MVL4_CANGL
MEYQSFGRIQRPKGINPKQALKMMLILAVCAWLLYQINHSRNNTENYKGQTKLDGGYGAKSLGRKGSWLEERALPHSGNVDSAKEAKDSSSGRDDESHGAKEDNAEEKIRLINEKFRTREEKEMELEPESQPKVSSKNKYKDLYKKEYGKVDMESRRSESGHKEHGNEKYQKRPIINDSKSKEKKEEVQLRERLNDEQIGNNAKLDFSEKENDGDEDTIIREKETRMQENVVESATNAVGTEEIDEVQSFHDENGVPPDGNETEIMFGEPHILHEGNISNVSEVRWLRKNITFAEDNDVEVNSEASKKDGTVGEEINVEYFRLKSQFRNRWR